MSKSTSTKSLPLPLANILWAYILPLWQQGGMERCLVVPRELTDNDSRQRWLVTGGRISSHPYKEKRAG